MNDTDNIITRHLIITHSDECKRGRRTFVSMDRAERYFDTHIQQNKENLRWLTRPSYYCGECGVQI